MLAVVGGLDEAQQPESGRVAKLSGRLPISRPHADLERKPPTPPPAPVRVPLQRAPPSASDATGRSAPGGPAPITDPGRIAYLAIRKVLTRLRDPDCRA